jgi:DNA-binding NarL/FixJ family response regulator
MTDKPIPLLDLQVLSLEDSIMDFGIIRDYLSDNLPQIKMTRVDKESVFIALLRQNKYDIILADYNLPGFNALSALSHCMKICPETPFICVSGAIGEETAIELLKQGAVDFVMKDKLERLPFAVKRALTEAAEKKAHLRADMHASLSYKILNLLNSNIPLAETIKLILALIQGETRIEAAGIRLKQGDDYPYFCQNGFTEEFLEHEDSLFPVNPEGNAVLTHHGHPILECTCGLVISGHIDPTGQDYTEGGSFCTNNSSAYLNLPADKDQRFNPRNRCIKEGYQSIAIIPIRADKEIIGLLQLNDRKKDLFKPDMIRFFETIGNIIGVAFMRKQSQESLEKSHSLLYKLSEQVPGVIYQYRLFPDGNSCFPYASSGMNDIYGVTPEEVREDATPVFGRIHPDDITKVSELIFESARNQSHFYCEFRVILPGKGLRWRYSDAVPELLEDKSTLWHGIIYDITKLKEAEFDLNKKMDELMRFHNLTVNRELHMIELKKEVNELLIQSGRPEKYRIVD